ncbi:hypothetical protein PFISCL1PPCAC_12011, partial [Pristionchus fissidentatus]
VFVTDRRRGGRVELGAVHRQDGDGGRCRGEGIVVVPHILRPRAVHGHGGVSRHLLCPCFIAKRVDDARRALLLPFVLTAIVVVQNVFVHVKRRQGADGQQDYGRGED